MDDGRQSQFSVSAAGQREGDIGQVRRVGSDNSAARPERKSRSPSARSRRHQEHLRAGAHLAWLNRRRLVDDDVHVGAADAE